MATPSASISKKLNVFICYSHADEALKREFVNHLSPLERTGLINHWHDRSIVPGEDWDERIKQKLNEADIIMPLISSDFIASEYCINTELELAFERHSKGEARLVPVIIRPCAWQVMSFSKIQALPKDGNPISKWADKDEAILDVINGIKQIIKAINSGSIKSVEEVARDTDVYERDTVVCLLPRGYVEIYNLGFQHGNWDIYATYYNYDGETMYSTHYATEYYKAAWIAEYRTRESQLNKLTIPSADHRFAHHIILLIISLGSRKEGDKISDIVMEHLRQEGDDVHFSRKGDVKNKPIMPSKYERYTKLAPLTDVIEFLDNVAFQRGGTSDEYVRYTVESKVREGYLFLEVTVGSHFFLESLRKLMESYNHEDDYQKIIIWSKRVKNLIEDASALIK